MPLADSPARRVLGNKTTNASIKSQKSVKTWNNPTSSRDSLSISFGEITRSPKPSVNFKGPRVGQKRRIEEVEDHERNESQQSTDTQRLSQATDFLSDGSSFPNEMMVDSVSNSKSTAQTSLTSFHASQTEPDAAEAEFEIHEEMSQRTLDKMHEISLPQNTSQPAALLRPSLLKETSQLSVSMSSLIDFDGDKSSQHSDGLQMLEAVDKRTVPEVARATSEEGTRKDLLSEKAETLRTRLQLAFFKVQTNQTSKPFARLNQPRSRSPELPTLPLSSSPLSSPPERRSHFTPISPESKIAIARARATMQAKPRVQPLNKLGHPTIVPTTFSARNLEDTRIGDKPQNPSSPPLTNGADGVLPTLVRVGTPIPPSKSKSLKQTANSIPRTPMQLSGPPGSPEVKLAAAAKLRQGKGKYGGLTSSVVKGEAASGLLELMRGGIGNGEDVEITE